MPLYWRRRRNFYRQPWRQRRRPFRRRRPRRFIRRQFRRRNWVRRRRRFRKKLLKIKLKQFQPRKIVKCKISGDIPLFVSGKTSVAHNYTLYKESYGATGESTGGAWSIQQFSLDCLYEEFLKYKNFWTKSNLGLPLTRYLGCRFKFYKSPFTDYIVSWSICPPFTVTKDMFLNMQPQRQLFEKRKILVPQLHSGTRKKYKKITLHPPSYFLNKWYFQQDICKTPLVLIQATACSFEQPYCPENHVSDSLTLYALNTDTFQNPDFESVPDTGYSPKHLGTKPMYLYGVRTGGTEPPKKWGDVLLLGRTDIWYEGNEHAKFNDRFFVKNNYGNPFAFPWNHEDHPIYYKDERPAKSDTDETTTTFTPLDHLYYECRYNPQKDKGTNNLIWLKPNNHTTKGTIFDPPENPKHILKDYPLWLAFYGWTDWLRRSNAVQELDSAYFIVVKSNYIYPPKPVYVFLDKYFVTKTHEDLTLRDKLKWHPKYEMQEEVEFYFASSGPFAPKINRSESIQANAKYDFYFKWGGCPAPMENIVSPCLQDKFPIPSTELQPYEIQDPKTDKRTLLYEWDERRGHLTKKCIKRIKTDSDTELSLTELSKFNVPVQTSETESEEEETQKETQKTLQQQLQQLREQQRLLKRNLLRLTQKQSLE